MASIRDRSLSCMVFRCGLTSNAVSDLRVVASRYGIAQKTVDDPIGAWLLLSYHSWQISYTTVHCFLKMRLTSEVGSITRDPSGVVPGFVVQQTGDAEHTGCEVFFGRAVPGNTPVNLSLAQVGPQKCTSRK